mmetsp:Transcript_33973/g.81658  ORF Transcript_33973/g.81658 Transcript_33973/m.81658 type:complete len:111 (-) Transcript_33973:623-955(-)
MQRKGIPTFAGLGCTHNYRSKEYESKIPHALSLERLSNLTENTLTIVYVPHSKSKSTGNYHHLPVPVVELVVVVVVGSYNLTNVLPTPRPPPLLLLVLLPLFFSLLDDGS